MNDAYKALALQLPCHAVNKYTDAVAKKQMLQQLEQTGKQIKASKAFIGTDLKLVVLPEYFLSGFPMGETVDEWQAKACIKKQDELYVLAAALASELNVYLSGNWYELDENFPGLYFQSSFIFNDAGKQILNYRRLNSMYAPTPHDVLDRYVELYGWQSLFPVADTPIGRLACIASEEILYPEIARCLVLNGAEILLHSSSEIGSTMPTQKNIAKQARALENMAYVVSANSAGITHTDFPSQSTNGHSQIVQYDGLKLCEAAFGESMVANCTLDIAALRRFRQRPGMANLLSRQRLELFAQHYQQSIHAANTLTGVQAWERSHFIQQQANAITLLRQKNIIV
jgi:deaminated glutathione amidase